MRNVADLYEESLLDGQAALDFAASRARVTQRHANWRANFPAFGALLDSDEDRAQALAGNYATEAREIVGVWLAAHAPESAEDVVERRVAWVREFWEVWRAAVFESTDFTSLEDGPRQRFTQVFDDLSTRFRDDAAGWLRAGGGSEEAQVSLWQRLTAPLRAVAAAVEGFFFPSVRR